MVQSSIIKNSIPVNISEIVHNHISIYIYIYIYICNNSHKPRCNLNLQYLEIIYKHYFTNIYSFKHINHGVMVTCMGTFKWFHVYNV